MFDDLHQKTNQIVEHLVKDGLVQKYYPKDNNKNKADFRLILPDTFSRDFIGIICSGHPEQAGIWAMSVLAQGLEKEASMGTYFQAFRQKNWGLIALNPHYAAPDDSGVIYQRQLTEIIQSLSRPKAAGSKVMVGIVSYSQGGKQVLDFLINTFGDCSESGRQMQALLMSACFVFVDTVPLIPFNALDKHETLREHLKTHSLVFSTAGQHNTNFGMATAALLNVTSQPVIGPHGMLPNTVLPEILDYFHAQQDTD